MANKTAQVKELAKEVLATIPEPYGNDVIEQVFVAIEQNANWMNKYSQLKVELSRDVVHNWIGKYTKKLTGMDSDKTTTAYNSNLITSFTLLKYT
jgi:hypothetical protein